MYVLPQQRKQSNEEPSVAEVQLARPLTASAQLGDSQQISDSQDCVSSSGYLAILDERSLHAECLATYIRESLSVDCSVFVGPEAFLQSSATAKCSNILLCHSGEMSEDTSRCVTALVNIAPTMILSQVCNVGHVSQAFSLGVRAYIPTNLPLRVAIEAMRLVLAGGTYVPPDVLASLNAKAEHERPSLETDASRALTSRQTAVVRALAMGMGNKAIAHELKMQESTVKVHVRNIMRKMQAKNRTEVALMARGASLVQRI